jgi:hypothetical protein
MPQPDWESIERQVSELARRVEYLERQTGLSAASVPEGPVMAAQSPESASNPLTSHPLADVPGALPVIGRALLGLAGAYLLRALTEAGTVPFQLGVVAGIVYAVVWLAWAARTPESLRLKTALYSLVAVLVLAPLLWEATVRFHAIDTWTAATLLVVFTVVGMAIAWRKSLLIVSSFATFAAIGTAAGLLVATHDVLPFTFLFLAVALAIETSACLEHWLSERWLGAAAADLSVLLATWLVTNARGLPEGYAPIPHVWLLTAQVALLTIYLASTMVRTLYRGFSFTAFETAQCALAFVIGLGGGVYMSPMLALVALVCALACYLVSFARLDRPGVSSRNFYAYSTFGILLALAGSRILLSGMQAAALWSVLAVACIWAGGHFDRVTLQVHGATYLLLALATSGAAEEATAFLMGAALWPGTRQLALWAGMLAAAAGYALVARSGRGPAWFRLTVAAVFVWLAAGIFAGALTGGYHVLFGAGASHAFCATLRTAVLAGLSILLAWTGPRWHRNELSRLIYPAMFLGGCRLIVQDLNQGHTGALFLSLLVYGAALTCLPRVKKAAEHSTA